nr:hypothetical protein [Tanacetum cinerariifolium]
GQNKNSTTSEDVASPNKPKPFVKFLKPKDSQSKSKTNKQETPKKLQVKYAEQYRHSNKKSNVKGNQRNNLKSYQLGPEFVLKKKACFNCGDFSHLANECRKRVQRETTRSQNHAYMSLSHRSAGHRPHGAPMRSTHRSAGHRPHGPSINPMRPNMNGVRPNRSFFIQAHSYETSSFLKSSALKTQYRAPWVPTVNRNNPPVNRKFSTGRRNFPTVNRKFPTASRKFTTGSTKIHTADMGRKGKAIAQPVMNMGQDQQIQNVGGNGGNQFGQYAGQVAQNQQRFNIWQKGRIQGAQNAGILDEIKEVNANCILMANLQQTSTSGTQHDRAPVYDTDGLADVHLNDNCYDNEIFNMFTQEEQYTDLLEPIPEPQLVPPNDNYVTSVASSMVHSGGTVETSSAPNEEIRAHQETVYRNLVDQVAQVNRVNSSMRATNAELKSKLARYKIQEQRVEISQEKYDKLEKCYQKSVYQEQCLTKKINALHLISAKQITTLKDEISNLNKQLSKEKSYMLNPKPDSFYHPNQKIALGYPNSLYLKKAKQKQQSLYNGNLLLKEHDPPAVYDSEETLDIAQETKFVRDFKSLAKEADESLDKQKYLELEIKRLLKASVSHDIMFIVQNSLVDVPFDLRTELDRTKEKLKLCIIKKEKEYAILWNNCNTPSVSNTLDPLNQKLKSKIVELEFQVVNYEREISHLKTTYKNLFDSIKSNRAHAKLHDLIYKNAQLRARRFENTSESVKNSSRMSVTPHVLRMINEADLQALADLKSIQYGLRSEIFDIELFVKLKTTMVDIKSVGDDGLASTSIVMFFAKIEVSQADLDTSNCGGDI